MLVNSVADLAEGPGGPLPPSILGKNRKITEGRKTGRARKGTVESLPRVDSSVPLTHQYPKRSWVNLFRKETLNPFSDLRIQSWTHPKFDGMSDNDLSVKLNER